MQTICGVLPEFMASYSNSLLMSLNQPSEDTCQGNQRTPLKPGVRFSLITCTILHQSTSLSSRQLTSNCCSCLLFCHMSDVKSSTSMSHRHLRRHGLVTRSSKRIPGMMCQNTGFEITIPFHSSSKFSRGYTDQDCLQITMAERRLRESYRFDPSRMHRSLYCAERSTSAKNPARIC